GLAFLHRARRVHRDLKPTNVLIDASGEARLLDFGVLRAIDAVGATPLYMAPEVASGQEATEASDLYSFGCVLYELLAKTPPFTGPPSSVKAKHLLEEPARPSLRAPCDAGLEALCLELLRKDPKARPSAKEALRALLDDAARPALSTAAQSVSP